MIDEFCEKQLSECLHVKLYKDRKRRRKTDCAADYQQHDALWDIIINRINRNPEFDQLPHNVQAIYNNNGRRNAVILLLCVGES
jgi:hypothetical protein